MSATEPTQGGRIGRTDPSPSRTATAPARPHAPEPKHVPEPKPSLEAVPAGYRTPASRRRRRRLALVAGVVAAIAMLFGLVVVHVQLTTNEMHLISLQGRANAAQDRNLKLRLQVEQLESPARIVAMAQSLGMVPPPSITYLPAAAGTATPPAPSASNLQGWALVKRVDTAP
jgi:cell division protein FtsL